MACWVPTTCWWQLAHNRNESDQMMPNETKPVPTQSQSSVHDRIRNDWVRLRALGVEHIDLFGSHARGDATPDSDIDVLVYLQPGSGYRALFAIREALNELLDGRVDVITPGVLAQRPRLRRSVQRDLQRVA